MKINKNFFGFMLITIMAISCSSTSVEQGELANSDMASGNDKTTVEFKEISIKGNIKNGANQSLYLQYLKVQDAEYLDTITIEKNGDYEFKFTPKEKGFYRVMLNDQNLFVVIVTGEEDIVVDANAENLYTSSEVKQSEETKKLYQLNKILGKRDSIGMILQTAQMNNDKVKYDEALAYYEGVVYEVDRGVKSFINENLSSFAALAAVQNLSPDSDFAYYVKVVESLNGIANGNQYYDALSSEVNAMRKLAPGSPAPEISLPTPNGEMLSLSDLKGKYVLIDFWASWCGPCRRENPNVKRVYDKYHNKGFEILGVSLDKNRSAWLAAIEQDGLNWNHISDLQYWNSAVVPEYQIKGIPLTVLVDKDGNIIEKNLRGQALEDKLVEIFGQ